MKKYYLIYGLVFLALFIGVTALTWGVISKSSVLMICFIAFEVIVCTFAYFLLINRLKELRYIQLQISKAIHGNLRGFYCVEGKFDSRDVCCKLVGSNQNSSSNRIFLFISMKPKIEVKQKRFYWFRLPKPTKDTIMTHGWLKKYITMDKFAVNNDQFDKFTFSSVRLIDEFKYLVDICKKIESREIKIEE